MSQSVRSIPITGFRPKVSLLIAVHVVAPVLLGAMIYTVWRTRTLLVFSWYQTLGLNTWIIEARHYGSNSRHLIPNVVLFSLPDALWVYSFTAGLTMLWHTTPLTYWKVFWICMPTALGAGGEIAQMYKIIPGTFDSADFWTSIIAGVSAVSVVSLSLRRGSRNDFAVE